MNPETTPDGISYDEKTITNLVKRGQFIDPTTRNRFHPNQLTPNFNLEKYIIDWLSDNPNANITEEYSKIVF